PRAIGAVAALVLIAGVGLVYTIDSASFDGTRWAVATAATKKGWSPTQIRGGFEWYNYYASDAHVNAHRSATYCVNVVVGVDPKRVDPKILVASASYHSPLTGSVDVVAIRTKKLWCRPQGVPKKK